MKTRNRLLLTAVASIALAGGIASPALATPPVASPAHVHFIGQCRAQGDAAICVASGSVKHPHDIHVHVVARAGQKVSGAWTMVCSKGSGAGGKSGKFHGFASLQHNLRRYLKMPYKHPDECSVSADAQLAHSGHIHIWLTAHN